MEALATRVAGAFSFRAQFNVGTGNVFGFAKRNLSQMGQPQRY